MNWTLTRNERREKWESDCGDYEILHKPGGDYVLVSFIHEPREAGQEFWAKAFRSVEEAMKHAEMI